MEANMIEQNEQKEQKKQEEKEQYDLFIIGGGPGGYTAAVSAAQLGAKVALAEACELGGTCLNRGCIPTKSMLYSAEQYRKIKNGCIAGINADKVSLEMDGVYERKNQVVSQLQKGVASLLKANKVDVFSGKAQITGMGEVTVSGERISARRILIASGSSAGRLNIPGADLPGVFTSDQLLAGSRPGKALVIIGGGVVGMEFASIYNSFGCQVTVLEGESRILPKMDREISQNLSMIMKKRGVKIYTNVLVRGIELTEEGKLVCEFSRKAESGSINRKSELEAIEGCDEMETVTSDSLLLSTGRKANVEGLVAEGLSLETRNGRIAVNQRFETSMEGVYAIGDVIESGMDLAHAASSQGKNAVSFMFDREPEVNLDAVPACVYTEPEIAAAGITADEAKTMGIPVKVGKCLMASNPKSIIEIGERGFVKIVVHKDTDVILGAQLMCGRASDLIGELVTAISLGLTLKDLKGAVKPHPGFSEGILDAVLDADKTNNR